MSILYKVYECKEESKWTLVETFESQEEAAVFSKQYAEINGVTTLIEVQDGGRH